MTLNQVSLSRGKRKRYGIEKSQLKKGNEVLITFPGLGTICLTVKKIVDDYVEGLVWQEEGYYQYNMPEDYHGEYEYMNFPISCIKEIL